MLCWYFISPMLSMSVYYKFYTRNFKVFKLLKAINTLSKLIFLFKIFVLFTFSVLPSKVSNVYYANARCPIIDTCGLILFLNLFHFFQVFLFLIFFSLNLKMIQIAYREPNSRGLYYKTLYSRSKLDRLTLSVTFNQI